MLRLKYKLGASILSLCILASVSTGVASYIESKAILSEKLSKTSVQTLTEVSTDITDYMGKFEALTDVSSKSEALTSVE